MLSSIKMNSVSAVSLKKGNISKLSTESLSELNKVNQISNANSNINDYSVNMNGSYEDVDYSKDASNISENANTNNPQTSFIGPIKITGVPDNIREEDYKKILNYAYKNNLGTMKYSDYEKNVNGNPLYKIDDYISSKATGDDILKDIKLYKSKNPVSAKTDIIFSQSDEEILAKILEIKNAEIARREKAKTETISPSDPLTMVAPIAENSKLQYSIPSAQNYYSKDNVSNINYQPTIDLEKCDFVDDQYKKHAKELQDEITEQRRLLGALDGLYSDFKHRVTDVNEFNKTHSDNYSSIQQRAIDFDGTKYYYNETQAIGALEVIKKNYQNQKDLVYKAEKELWDYKIAAIQGTDYYKNYVKNIDIDAHLSDVSEAKYMTTEEKQFYCYLLETENEEISNSYFNHLKGEINSREGLERALKFVSELDLNDPNAMDYVKTHFKGLGDGTEQFFHGIEVWFTGPSKELTADQYEVLYIMELLKQSNANIETAIGDINGLEKVYSLSISEGNMLPAMVVGAIGSTFDCPELGAIVMFASVSGNSTENSYQQGYDLWSSWFYGIMDGASEATLEYLLGGIPGVSKLDDMGLLARAVSEGFEESMQEILDPYLRYIAFGEDPKVDVKKVLEAGIDGMVLAAYLNGGSIAITSGVTVSVDFLQENYDKIKNLEASGVEVDYNRITEEGYIDSLQNGTVKEKNEHVKLADMTPEQVNKVIEAEIASLDPKDSNYKKNVEALKLKGQLELSLIEKLSATKENSSSPQKSIDLLSSEQQQQVKSAAHEVRSDAELKEPAITKVMQSLTDSNARLEGLDFKLKSESSIQDKISRKLYKGLSVDQAKDSIQDSVRYTLILSGNYEVSVIEKLRVLKSQGYEIVDINNAWGNDIYQGLNVNLKTKDGVYLELQFHTEESFNTKEHLNHELYELSRNTSTSKEVREISDQIQAINQKVYVGNDTTFSFKDVSELNMALDYYGNFGQKISNKISKKAKPLAKAKYIYNYMNSLMEYNADYYFGNAEEKNTIKNQNVKLNNVTNNKVVCSTWSIMFCELLNQNGISAKIMGKAHKWVVFELPDGTKWAADATQPYNGMTDLTNSKLGLESGGFFQITEEMYNSNDLLEKGYFYNSKAQSKAQFNNDSLLKKIDAKNGFNYENVSELFIENHTEAAKLRNQILDISADSTSGEIAAAKLEKIIFPKMTNLKGMEGLGYYSAMRGIFSESELKLIKWEGVPAESGSGYDIKFTVDMEDGKFKTYIYGTDGTITKK